MGHVHAMVVCNSNNSRICIRRFEGTGHAFTELMKITSILLCAVLLPLSAAAQTPDVPATEKTSEALGDLPVPSWAKSILDSFDKPLHPVIGGVASGGGMAAGVGYESPAQVGWFREGEALFSIRRYWSVAGEIGKRARVEAIAIRRIRRPASHGPARFLWNRIRNELRGSVGIPTSRIHLRRARMDPSRLSCPPWWKRVHVHARFGTRRSSRRSFNRRCVPGRARAGTRRRTGLGPLSRIRGAFTPDTRRARRRRHIQQLPGRISARVRVGARL